MACSDEEQQRAPQPRVLAGVGPPPQRRQGVRGPGQEQVVDVREPLRRQPGAVVHLVDGEGVGRHLRRQRQTGDAVEDFQVGVVRHLLVARAVHAVMDQHRPQANPLPGFARRGVRQRLERPHEVVLGQLGRAVRTGEDGARAAGGGVEGLVEEHDFAGAVSAREELAPHGVVDAPRPAVGVARLVHPADLGLDLPPAAGPRRRGTPRRRTGGCSWRR